MAKRLRVLILSITFLLIAAVASGLTTGASARQPLTNDAIVKMFTAGLGEQIILSTINAQNSQFDVTPNALISLKETGLSDTIIAAMVSKRPSRPAESAPANESLANVPPAGPGREVLLRDGTEVRLRLVKGVTSATARVGDRVEFTVVEGVVVDGVTVIEKDALARGQVTEAEKKKSFGRRGKLDFTIDVVQALDGQNISLRATREAQGDDQYGKAGVITILTGPFGWFVKGKDVEVEAGEEYTIYINGDRRITLNDYKR